MFSEINLNSVKQVVNALKIYKCLLLSGKFLGGVNRMRALKELIDFPQSTPFYKIFGPHTFQQFCIIASYSATFLRIF